MMAASHDSSLTGRIGNVASVFTSENKAVVSDIRKALMFIREVSVDLEREKESQMVKELDGCFVQLLDASADHTHFSSAIEAVCAAYDPPGEQALSLPLPLSLFSLQMTDFGMLLELELRRLKSAAAAVQTDDPLLRQLRLAVWNVHHVGQPLPGEESEEIVMTDTQGNLLNVVCPLTGKPITELLDPVRSMDCKHIYGQEAIMAYVAASSGSCLIQCPVAGCPKPLHAKRIVCDPLLVVEMEELRTATHHGHSSVEDFTNPPETAEPPHK